MKQRQCRNGIADESPVGQGGGGDAHDTLEEAGECDNSSEVHLPLPKIMNVGQFRFGMSDSPVSGFRHSYSQRAYRSQSQIRKVREVVSA